MTTPALITAELVTLEVTTETLLANGWLRGHVARLAKNPEPGSDFARKNSLLLRLVPGWLLPFLMAAKGYGGLVFLRGGEAIAHLFFQRRRNGWHLFQLWVKPEWRRQGIGVYALACFLELAFAAGQTRVRAGKGVNQGMEAAITALIRDGGLRSCRVKRRGQGWLKLSDKMSCARFRKLCVRNDAGLRRLSISAELPHFLVHHESCQDSLCREAKKVFVGNGNFIREGRLETVAGLVDEVLRQVAADQAYA